MRDHFVRFDDYLDQALTRTGRIPEVSHAHYKWMRSASFSQLRPRNGGELPLLEIMESGEHAGGSWQNLAVLVREYSAVWLSKHVCLIDKEVAEEHVAAAIGFTKLVTLALSSAEVDDPYDEVVVCCSQEVVNEPARTLQGLFRLMARETAYKVLESASPERTISSPMFQSFLDIVSDNSYGRAKIVSVSFHQAQIAMLATFRGALSISGCTLDDGGQQSLFDIIARGEGPTELELLWTKFDSELLRAAVASTNCSLERLKLHGPSIKRLPLVFEGVRESQSLTELSIVTTQGTELITVEQFVQIFESLKQARSLKMLAFGVHMNGLDDVPRRSVTLNELKKRAIQRTRVIVDMLNVNRSLLSLKISPLAVDERIMRGQVQPRLKKNLFRPRIANLAKVDDENIGRKLLLAALAHPEVNSDSNVMYEVLRSKPELLPDPTTSRRRVRRVEFAPVGIDGPSAPKKQR